MDQRPVSESNRLQHIDSDCIRSGRPAENRTLSTSVGISFAATAPDLKTGRQGVSAISSCDVIALAFVLLHGSRGRDRTCDNSVNSRALLPLSYPGMWERPLRVCASPLPATSVGRLKESYSVVRERVSSSGREIRTPINSSRGCCPAIGRFPKNTN